MVHPNLPFQLGQLLLNLLTAGALQSLAEARLHFAFYAHSFWLPLREPVDSSSTDFLFSLSFLLWHGSVCSSWHLSFLECHLGPLFPNQYLFPECFLFKSTALPVISLPCMSYLWVILPIRVNSPVKPQIFYFLLLFFSLVQLQFHPLTDVLLSIQDSYRHNFKGEGNVPERDRGKTVKPPRFGSQTEVVVIKRTRETTLQHSGMRLTVFEESNRERNFGFEEGWRGVGPRGSITSKLLLTVF